jgi:hypothetical protein
VLTWFGVSDKLAQLPSEGSYACQTSATIWG